MTLLQLKYIVTAAAAGSISEAAKQLYIAQPSLTAAIKELESELGITIFRRTNKGILLSAEGEEFLGYARQVIEQTNLIEERYLGAAPVKHQFCVSTQQAHKDLNNRVIAGAPEGMVINTHVCRGNFHSTYANSGAYDPVADILFGEENVNAYYLEFDDERSGGFAPLARVSGEKKVVLGLITTKSPKLEDKNAVIARIHQAAKYIPLDRLSLSPQCGFASCEIGNKLTEEEQWAKLALVREIAEEVWH